MEQPLISDQNINNCVIPERVLDVDVPVKTDGTQVEDGGGRAHNIEGDPGVTKLGSKNPVSQEIVDDREGHDKGSYEEIGYGEGCQEEIPDPPQASVRIDRHTHQDVAKYRDED
ncbi:hypothetical protein J6590_049858 [Homalodisca vitripennis]|nr:hypothetical protein J6590_049858 [Homalodisca vitripennis]